MYWYIHWFIHHLLLILQRVTGWLKPFPTDIGQVAGAHPGWVTSSSQGWQREKNNTHTLLPMGMASDHGGTHAGIERKSKLWITNEENRTQDLLANHCTSLPPPIYSVHTNWWGEDVCACNVWMYAWTPGGRLYHLLCRSMKMEELHYSRIYAQTCSTVRPYLFCLWRL